MKEGKQTEKRLRKQAKPCRERREDRSRKKREEKKRMNDGARKEKANTFSGREE